MTQAQGPDEKYLAIQELKEKIMTAQDAIKHASSELQQQENLESRIANDILIKYNHPCKTEENSQTEADKKDDLELFNRAQQDIAQTTQIMQSHQENIIHWRKQMGEIINSVFCK